MNIKKSRRIVVAMVLIATTILSPVTGVHAEENSDPNVNIEGLSETVGVEISGSNFPDPEFRKYVSIEFDKDTNGCLSPEEINDATDIVVSLSPIKSLQGIEFFSMLERLDCGLTEIDTLDVSQNRILTELDCSRTNITTLNVSQNDKLEFLDCGYTYITDLNVSKNIKLESLYCSDTNITTLNVSQNDKLEFLGCGNTDITDLNVSKNIKLESLNCYNTGIDTLDVGQNRMLIELYCSETNITTLNVSNNSKLRILDCSYTNITTLNVSQNKMLAELHCTDTNITTLNVSGNTLLRFLHAEGVPLTYLNIGNNINLSYINVGDPRTVDFKVTGNTFNIKDANEEIKLNNVNLISGGKLDSLTGIISDYTIGTPIKYTYASGVGKNGPVTLNVSLNLIKSDPLVTINKDLNKAYDGNKVNLTDTDIAVKGSTGAISYLWEVYNGASWVANDVPVNPGKYRVKVSVAEDPYYEAISDTKEFIISKGDTSVTINKNLNKVYDGNKVNLADNDITVKGSKGTTSYLWEIYNGSSWVTSDVPMNAGKYRVTVNVMEDEYYLAGVSTVEFEIKKVSDNTKKNGNKVETGDSNHIELWMSLGMLSLLILGVSIIKRRSLDK